MQNSMDRSYTWRRGRTKKDGRGKATGRGAGEGERERKRTIESERDERRETDCRLGGERDPFVFSARIPTMYIYVILSVNDNAPLRVPL